MSQAARLRSFYFLYYCSSGAYLPYISQYLRGIGFLGEQIGMVQMSGPLIAIPAALLWAGFAGRLAQPTRALHLATVWSFVALCFLPIARTPLAVGAVVLLYGFADRAIIPFVDSIALEQVRAQPGLAYGRLRLFGSLGFIVVAQGLGYLLSLRGDRPGDLAVPVAVLLGAGAYLLVARTLPGLVAPSTQPRLAYDAGKLLRDPRLALLLLAGAIHWGSCAPFHLLYGVLVPDLGFSSKFTGLGMAVAVSAEMGGLFSFPLLERRFSLGTLLAASFAGTSLRWLLLSHSGSLATIVGLQALHGLTMGTFWGATMSVMGRIVPARLRVVGQALITALIFGLGNGAGYLLAGAGYDRFGDVRPLFEVAALVELVPLALSLVLYRLLSREPVSAAEPAALAAEP